jgi:hypothetical protein
VRGKLGTIDRDHGVFVFPDTNAHFSAKATARVFGTFRRARVVGKSGGASDSVYVDLWDDYLGRPDPNLQPRFLPPCRAYRDGTALFSPNPGKQRPLRWPFDYLHKVNSLGKNGRPRWPVN